jgi:hypothetical protein
MNEIMDKTSFQNGFALGMASSGVIEIEVPAKEEQEKTATITENGMVEVFPDENMALSKVTVDVNVPSKEEQEKTIAITENGTTEILPDDNKTLSKVTVVTDVAGGGIQYTSIAYKEDDTIELLDTDGTPHTMVCVYEDDKLKSVTYDEKSVELTYDEDGSIAIIGRTDVDIGLLLSDRLYSHYEVDKNEYPYVAICKNSVSGILYFHFFQTYSYKYFGDGSATYYDFPAFDTTNYKAPEFPSDTDYEAVVNYVIENIDKTTKQKDTGTITGLSGKTIWTNITDFQFNGATMHTIDSNGTDFQNGFALGMASGGVVEVGGGTEEIETLIDESGVFEDTEGSVTEKVEELIEKAKRGSSPSINENGIVSFGGNTTIDENGVVSL